MSQSQIRIFDTTLRDGEQAPGCTMTLEEKLEVARQLARLGVDIIEAGFPAASPGDWEAVHTIAREVGTSDGPVICGLARANEADIDRCNSATLGAARRRIHVFLATSDIHLEHKLRMTRSQVLDATAAMVRYARSLCDEVEFSPEDASRSDPEFLHEVLRAAVESGASTLNIPDTVGYSTPEEYAALIRGICEEVVAGRDVTVSTHCHDDLGLAVANSLAGVRAGARQVECTVNGIGERAGNASLEEVVMALQTRRSYYGMESAVDSRELARTSRLVSSCTGVHVPPNKAIVGANAFAHEAGIHQDGVLKNRLTYEIMSAETVGLDGNILVLGKHSGRHAFRKHLAAMGYELADEELRHAFARFKEIADRKKIVDERDIEAIVSGEARRSATIYALEHAAVTCGTHLMPTAIVRLRGPDGKLRAGSAQGSGAVDAVCRTIQEIIEADDPDGASGGAELVEFTVNSITEGLDAVGEVTMRLKECAPVTEQRPSQRIAATGDRRAHVFSGYGVHTDVIMATAEAYIGALNKLLLARRERDGKGEGEGKSTARRLGQLSDPARYQNYSLRITHPVALLRLSRVEEAYLLDRADLDPIQRAKVAIPLAIEEHNDSRIRLRDGSLAAVTEHPRTQGADQGQRAVLGRLIYLRPGDEVAVAPLPAALVGARAGAGGYQKQSGGDDERIPHAGLRGGLVVGADRPEPTRCGSPLVLVK